MKAHHTNISHNFNSSVSFLSRGIPQAPSAVTQGFQHTSSDLVADTLRALEQFFQGLNSFADVGSLHQGQAPVSQQQPLNIAVIDDFVAEKDGFNHGEMVASTIEGGGALGDGHAVNTLRFNIDKPGADRTEMISRSLDQVIQRVRNGETINAVNLSQQAFSQTATTRKINHQIDQLEAMGVAVVVAAGNKPGQTNELARSADIVVENADAYGNRAATSGVGNVRAQGRSTSVATANFATLAAFRQAKSQSPRSAAFSAIATMHSHQAPDR